MGFRTYWLCFEILTKTCVNSRFFSFSSIFLKTALSAEIPIHHDRILINKCVPSVENIKLMKSIGAKIEINEVKIRIFLLDYLRYWVGARMKL